MMKPLFILAAVFAVLFVFTAHAGESNAHNVTPWPSLRFRFTIKRSSMQLHGHSHFSVLANPIVTMNDSGDLVLYDTFAAFTEGSTVYNYTLVNGRGYASRASLDNGNSSPSVECEDTELLLPINSIVDALGEAVPVSSISSKSGGAIQCSAGSTLKVSVDGTDFGLCFSGPLGFTMYGDDMDIALEYVKDVGNISAPILATDCDKVASPSSVTSVGRSLLTGKSLSPHEERRLKEAALTLDFVFGDDESCTCKSTPRPCIFVHGLGIFEEEPENLDVFPTHYWGNLTGHAPCCSSIKYTKLNTLNNSWTDDEQQQKVYDRILAVSETSQGTTVSDTIIVTHSMGGLLVAGAVATGKCSLDSSVSWVGLAAPMRGSMASDYFQNSCQNETNFVAEKLVAKAGYCPAGDGIKSMAYEGGEIQLTGA